MKANKLAAALPAHNGFRRPCRCHKYPISRRIHRYSPVARKNLKPGGRL